MGAYLGFSKGMFKKSYIYKANMIMGSIGQVIMVLVTFFLWKAIYSSSTHGVMKGFTVYEMLTYVMISFTVGLAVQSNIRNIIFDEVRDGSIAMALIKPINYTRRLFFMGLGRLAFCIIFLFVPALIVTVIYALNVGIHLTILNIILFLISIFFGFIINLYYSYMFGLLTFKFYNIWGLSQIASAVAMLVSGSLIPLTFFPSVFQKIFEILPFSSIIYTPSMIFLGKLSTPELIKALSLQILWVVIFFVIAKLLWKLVVNKLSIQGG